MNRQLIEICQQLAREGKTPSVALVRARYPGNAPMPRVIEAIKQWKQQPDAPLPDEEKPTAPTLTLEQRVEALERDVEQLKRALRG